MANYEFYIETKNTLEASSISVRSYALTGMYRKHLFAQ